MKIVLTGSSSGIGKSLATHLISHGHLVWGLARTNQEDLARNGRGFRSSICDVSNFEIVQKVAAQVALEWHSVDALICCAGIQGEIGRALVSDPIRWAATVHANLNGTYFTIRAFAPLLVGQPRRAKVVCFSGGGATKPRPNFTAYGCAKTAIVRLVETIAEEEPNRALDINAIAPGPINTRLTEEVLSLGPEVVGAAEYATAKKQKESGGFPIDKVCGLVNWLISPASDNIRGRLISAPWDPWIRLGRYAADLESSDIYTLRRIVPEDRGKSWVD